MRRERRGATYSRSKAVWLGDFCAHRRAGGVVVAGRNPDCRATGRLVRRWNSTGSDGMYRAKVVEGGEASLVCSSGGGINVGLRSSRSSDELHRGAGLRHCAGQ
jgi:hypothetical protein